MCFVGFGGLILISACLRSGLVFEYFGCRFWVFVGDLVIWVGSVMFGLMGGRILVKIGSFCFLCLECAFGFLVLVFRFEFGWLCISLVVLCFSLMFLD